MTFPFSFSSWNWRNVCPTLHVFAEVFTVVELGAVGWLWASYRILPGRSYGHRGRMSSRGGPGGWRSHWQVSEYGEISPYATKSVGCQRELSRWHTHAAWPGGLARQQLLSGRHLPDSGWERAFLPLPDNKVRGRQHPARRPWEAAHTPWESTLWLLLDQMVRGGVYSPRCWCYKVRDSDLGRVYTQFNFYCFMKWELFSASQ